MYHQNNKITFFRSATKYNILHCNYKIPQHISESSNSLIRGLLQLDVENRLGGYDAELIEGKVSNMLSIITIFGSIENSHSNSDSQSFTFDDFELWVRKFKLVRI